ncbi:MAG: Hsp70 family protein [Armatimonadetes bacterium]|nr:Hsp70 family protein [Armatimonadota bacterium]
MATNENNNSKETVTVLGIDLGTTNCAVCAATASGPDDAALKDFAIRQVTHPGNVEALPVLPSFLYLPGPHELPEGSLALPWAPDAKEVVGQFARDHGAKIPHHLISSAKSWLCFEGADRRGDILPWKAPEDVPRRSPVEAAAAYLSHIRQAWNDAHPEQPFEDLDVVLTVPASFDAVARELTAEAARKSGLEKLTLLEEPQAALYSWLNGMGDGWRKQVSVGDMILVCDIGGGTTDFSLIAVSEDEGSLVLERIAVGDHLLLGGDNMDLALAVAVQARLKSQGTRLDSWQFQVLVHECRAAKEKLLGDSAEGEIQIVIPGRGSSLIGGSLKAELLRSDVEAVLLGGFFPPCASSERAQKARRVGLAELGLPFEADAAVTRHLATFLGVHLPALEKFPDSRREGQTFAHPTHVLFNGGVLKSPLLRGRILEVVNGWLESEDGAALQVLNAPDLDLAVARGAAHYGLVRHGRGIRIRGGTSRTYYIGVEVARPAVPGMAPPLKAVCVAPKGMEEGTHADLEGQDFGLVVGEDVEFRFLGSTTREQDAVGSVIDDWDADDDSGIDEITTVSVSLDAEGRGGQLVPVRLRSVVTEVGTLELWCVERDGPGRWKLEFDVRDTADVEVGAGA